MKKQVINVPGVSKHLKKEGIPLSTAVRAGGFVFVSGQPPVDRRTGRKYFRRNPPARVFCTVGSWPKKFDVEIDCLAIV